ncbi:MAG: hypothetical protein ABS899_07195, partial [Desemzia incerta]
AHIGAGAAPGGDIYSVYGTANTSGGGTEGGKMDFIRSLAQFEKITVIGLMTMAPKNADTQTIRKTFSELKQLRDEVQLLGLSYAPCTKLSMGMSQDYPIAIEEGSNFVRIGSAFFKNTTVDED